MPEKNRAKHEIDGFLSINEIYFEKKYPILIIYFKNDMKKLSISRFEIDIGF